MKPSIKQTQPTLSSFFSSSKKQLTHSTPIEPQHQNSLKRLRKLQLSDDEHELPPQKRISINGPTVSSIAPPLTVPPKQSLSAQSPPAVTPINKSTPQFALIQQDDYADFEDRTPDWARGNGVKDKNGRAPNDPDYDPTTLLIPPSELSKMTPTMRQFWKIKSSNFDKIIFFKLGKFYEIFYEDAVICHKHLELNWMARKMHVGFPEKALDKFASRLVQLGYRVAVVEQMETPAMQAQRNQAEKARGIKMDKTIHREIVEVVTKGTMKEPIQDHEGHNLVVQEKYLMSIRQQGDEVAAVLLECATDAITIVHLPKDPFLEQFRTVVQQYRPVEVVVQQENIQESMLSLLHNTNWSPVISYLPNNALQWNTATATTQLSTRQYQSQDEQVLINKISQQESVMQALSGMFSYLDHILILDRVLSLSLFSEYCLNNQTKYLLLDSQCLTHLEILSSSQSTPASPHKGSLYEQINFTKTPMGSRLLRKWILAPLLQIEPIIQRQDAIAILDHHKYERDNFRASLRTLPDLERLCCQLYALNIRNKRQAIYFEDLNTKHMKMLVQLVKQLNKAYSILQNLRDTMDCSSGRLHTLLHTLLPDIPSHLAPFQNIVTVSQNKDKKDIYTCNIPDRGTAQARKQIESELLAYLHDQRQRLGDNRVTYYHGVQQYQLEVPEELVAKQKKPSDYEFSSKKAGYQRFLSTFIRAKVIELEQQEGLEEEETRDYLLQVLSQFYKEYRVWARLIEVLSELDVLCSLSVLSHNTPDMTRPSFLAPTHHTLINMKGMSHLVLRHLNTNFITNDLEMDQQSRVVVLTGPNMGGKSTLLRTLATNVILAQMGCHVACNYASLKPIDRIFTRLGASDSLLQGKSTFYLELEETLTCLSYATPSSLCILDELGRGTSTFDGISIAHSVLNHLINHIGARCFFATHYHSIITDFLNRDGVAFRTMAYSFTKDTLVHLYKLIPGVTTDSFGIDVAKIAGLPSTILEQGRIQSQAMLLKLEQQREAALYYSILSSLSLT